MMIMITTMMIGICGGHQTSSNGKTGTLHTLGTLGMHLLGEHPHGIIAHGTQGRGGLQNGHMVFHMIQFHRRHQTWFVVVRHNPSRHWVHHLDHHHLVLKMNNLLNIAGVTVPFSSAKL